VASGIVQDGQAQADAAAPQAERRVTAFWLVTAATLLSGAVPRIRGEEMHPRLRPADQRRRNSGLDRQDADALDAELARCTLRVL